MVLSFLFRMMDLLLLREKFKTWDIFYNLTQLYTFPGLSGELLGLYDAVYSALFSDKHLRPSQENKETRIANFSIFSFTHY